MKKEVCIIWPGSKNDQGYGLTRLCGKVRLSHRVAWELFNGPIPKGLFVLHKCDNPPCVNPKHLEIGDHKKNMGDCLGRGRHYFASQTHCVKGHPFSKDNTLLILQRGFRERVCLQCNRERARFYYRRKFPEKKWDYSMPSKKRRGK